MFALVLVLVLVFISLMLMEDLVENSRDNDGGMALKNLLFVVLRLLVVLLLVLVNELVKGRSIKQLEQKPRRHCLFLWILCGIDIIIFHRYSYDSIMFNVQVQVRYS